MDKKLKKLIEKAWDNGWRPKEMNGRSLKKYELYSVNKTYSHWGKVGASCLIPNSVILFDKEFIKAIFGDKKAVCVTGINNKLCSCSCQIIPWQYHFQQAVISKDPIEYYFKQKLLWKKK